MLLLEAEAARRRARDLQRRQRPARRRDEPPEEIRRSSIRRICSSAISPIGRSWSPTAPPTYRYNDREIIRAFADNSAATFEWLIAHGVVFVDKAPDAQGGESVGNSVARENHAAIMDWTMVQTGRQADPSVRLTMSSGNGLLRPLAAAAQRAGVEVALEHRVVGIYRESPRKGRVLGVLVERGGKHYRVRARKAVVVATGGSTTNVNFRRMFDPRLTEEYCGVAGMPYSAQDALGELAAMDVGAALWGAANQTGEFGSNITKPGTIGSQFGYVNLQWMPGSPVWSKARATGLKVKDWQDVITVNMIGRRFYDETGKQFAANDVDRIDPYNPRSYLNAKNAKWAPDNWINAALAGIGDDHNGGGPIWAIFDADAVGREGWDPQPPNVDFRGRLFLRRQHARGSGAHDRDALPTRPDAARRAGRDGYPLQRLRRFRP